MRERKQFEEYFSKVWVGVDLIQSVASDCAFRFENSMYLEEVVQEHWVTWQASVNRADMVLVPKNHLEKYIGFMTTAQCHPSNSNEYEVSIDETIDVFSKILEQSNES